MSDHPTDAAPPLRVLPCGDLAVLVELADASARRGYDAALQAELRADRLPGVLEHVPAARTVLVSVSDSADLPATVERLRRLRPIEPGEPAAGKESELLEIPVRYDGADLDDVARHLGCSAQDVVRRHTGQEWRVEFAGFAPGFGYLLGSEGGLEVPRRESPRTRIPPGAVGLAGPYSGVYPRASPGGWQLIGQTDLPMWDEHRDPPALLTPGRLVRFREASTPCVREVVTPVSQPRGRTGSTPAAGPGLEVEAVGPLATIQDLGRRGHAALGVTTSGAADRAALRLGNRILANPAAAAGIEALLGGVTLHAHGRVTVAVTGAPVAVRAGGRPASMGVPLDLRDGDTLRLGSPVAGLRTVVCVAGGIEAERLFDSSSTDPTAGLGPPPLAVGHRLRVGRPGASPAELAGVDVAPSYSPPLGALTLRVVLGPRDDWFTADAVRRFLRTSWRVTDQADRVGVRLDGPPLERAVQGELASEAVVRGAVQVPPSGLPLVFGPDHPTTGGYPVLAVVLDADTDALGQLPPGASVRFVAVRPN